jgi:hypothetical protein
LYQAYGKHIVNRVDLSKIRLSGSGSNIGKAKSKTESSVKEKTELQIDIEAGHSHYGLDHGWLLSHPNPVDAEFALDELQVSVLSIKTQANQEQRLPSTFIEKAIFLLGNPFLTV